MAKDAASKSCVYKRNQKLNRARPHREATLADSVYKVVEVVGTSSESISKAIDRAISKAGTTLRHLGWFEVAQIRGSIEDGQIRQYQVTVKVGFTLEDDV